MSAEPAIIKNVLLITEVSVIAFRFFFLKEIKSSLVKHEGERDARDLASLECISSELLGLRVVSKSPYPSRCTPKSIRCCSKAASYAEDFFVLEDVPNSSSPDLTLFFDDDLLEVMIEEIGFFDLGY